jgi:hypothetical protein
MSAILTASNGVGVSGRRKVDDTRRRDDTNSRLFD